MRAAALLPVLLAFGASSPFVSTAAAARNCVMAGEDRVVAAGQDDDAPPRFSRGFYRLTFTIEVSLDGLDGRDLPVSVESVCGIPRARAKEAMQLSGADGVAVIYASTPVWVGRSRLLGSAARAAIGGADTAILRVRLARPRSWREDEDGGSVPTFRTLRALVTD